MDELVFKSEKGTPVTNSLLVAKKFGKLHKNVLRAIDDVIAQTPKDQTRLNFAPSEYIDESGKSNRMYVMTKDGFSAVVLGFTGEQAIRFRWEYIEAFNKMEELIRTGDYQIPKSYSEALMIAARQAEQIEQQQKQLSLQTPKVLFADAVATSDRSVLVSELAKILKQNGIDIGQNRLFEWLRQHEYLCSKGEYYNQPSQKAMELKLFEVKKTTITKPDGTTLVTTTTKVTGKGQIYFVNKFLYKIANKINI
jgi:anti-repressor protein